MIPARQVLDAAKENEADFQTWIIDLAYTTGWTIAHFRGVRIQRKNGSVYYATPAALDGEGWPDLVLCRAPVTLFREVKRQRGTVEIPQQGWLSLLAACGQDVGVWRPEDRPEIERILKR